MTLNELIDKNGISKAHLAKRIDMNESTFKNKLSKKHSARFTGPEEVAIMQVIESMGKDFINFTKTV